MAQNSYTGVNTGCLMDLVCNLLCRAVAFRNDNDVMVAALDAADTHFLYNVHIKIQLTLGQADRRCADCAADMQRQMACAAAHNLDHRAALMGLHGVAQFIDAFDRGIARGIKADRIISADDIVIDCARYADAGHPLAGQRLRTAEGTVAAAADQAVNAQIFAGVGCLLQALFRHHFLAACGIQHSAAAADDTVHTTGAHLNDIAIDQSAVSTADAEYGNVKCGCGTHDRTDERVHARCITATGENANSADLFFHNMPPCIRLPSSPRF